MATFAQNDQYCSQLTLGQNVVRSENEQDKLMSLMPFWCLFRCLGWCKNHSMQKNRQSSRLFPGLFRLIYPYFVWNLVLDRFHRFILLMFPCITKFKQLHICIHAYIICLSPIKEIYRFFSLSCAPKNVHMSPQNTKYF